MIEIGSEFWITRETYKEYDLKIPSWLELGSDNKLLLSGRTAIDYVLKDIQKNKKVETVYFPSYCCQSMLQPFIDSGINIVFYDVYFEDELTFNINVNQECDIFFAMNYFGFLKGRMDSYIEEFKQRNIIVVEDSTHSLLSDKSNNNQSDYVIASLRKWFAILSGGLAVKTHGQFDIDASEETFVDMVGIRKIAMLEKGRYMNGDTSIEKARFLDKYRTSNNMLNKNYSLYSIDKESHQILQTTDLKTIIVNRKNNAKVLYEELLKNKRLKLLFPELESNDCPIFVPIILENKKERNMLREHLIKNDIYCPVHWPQPDILNKGNTNNINDKELSLINDQRYDYNDIEYLIRRINQIYE